MHQIGDWVYHLTYQGDGDEERLVGEITGFCPGPKWVRVTTGNGHRHIWLKENIVNMSAEEREYEARQTPGA